MHTNETDYLKLPQFAGSDHPTFQGDFNSAFESLDSFAKDTDGDLTALFSSTNTIETLTNSLNESVNDLTSLNSTMSANIQDLAQKYTITNNALNSLSNTVEGFETSISNATTTANSAKTTAESASSIASNNGQRISDLETSVSSIETTANTAKTTADSAKSTATTANTNANTAKTNASSATTTANNAKSRADEAYTLADLAKTNADTAITNYSSLKKTVDAIVSFTVAKFKESALDAIYPVGSVYLSVVNTSPSTFLGGTWSKISSGKYFYTSTSSGNTTGGSTTASFKLTADQSPWQASSNEATGYGLAASNTGFTDRVPVNRQGDVAKTAVSINLTPSYYTVIAWRRTA